MVRQTVVASAIFGLGISIWSHSSFAEGALAVGLPNGDPRNGFTYGATVNRSPEEARSVALNDCRGTEVRDTSKAKAACKIIETFRDQCINAAFNGDAQTVSTAVGWGVGPDSETANNRAMTMCEIMRRGNGRPCKLDGEPACDGSAR